MKPAVTGPLQRATGKDDPTFERQSWPLPGPDMDLLEWVMTYGNDETVLAPRMRLEAAAVISAYKALVGSRRAAKIAAALRRTARARSGTRTTRGDE